MTELLTWRHFILHFALQDLKRQHSATMLGYWWLVITYFITIFGIAWVYAALWNQSTVEFLPYLSAGILVWNFAANTFNESTRLFPGQVSILTNFTIPPISFFLLLILRQLFVLGYATIVHLLVLLYCGTAGLKEMNLWALALIPAGYVLIALAVGCLSLPVALAATRFRDVAPLVGNLTYLVFLVTPILWREEQLPAAVHRLMNLNPFVWILRVIRPLMMARLPEFFDVAVLLAGIVLAGPACVWLYDRLSGRLVYWVR